MSKRRDLRSKTSETADEARARLAAIVESSDDAIISKALDGTIVTWNKAAERIFGYAAEEMIGSSVALLFPDDQPDEEAELLDSICGGARVDHYETKRVRKDGTLIDVSLTLSPIRDDSGRIIGASKIVRDISARKQAERELAEAQEKLRKHNEDLEKTVADRTAKLQETIGVLDSFCHTIAHDLRAPLRALSGFSKDLKDTYSGKLNDEGNQTLDRIVAASGRMDQLILDLLRLGRISTADLTSEAIDLGDVIRDSQSLLEVEFIRSRAQLHVVHPLHFVQANRVLLGQMITNLIANALKFVPPERTPRVTIRSELSLDHVRVWVEDNGIGIRPDHARKLFQPFLRLVSSDQYPGTGVGLAIVRKAAERMGGRVGVTSNVGQGSSFWIELPAAPLRPGEPQFLEKSAKPASQ